jgi:alpha-tubulin suppressor-like RCC1 family protein
MYRGLIRLLSVSALAVPAALMAGCTSESTTGPRIVSIAAVSGLGQSGLVGGNLAQPLVVRAEDQSGDPVEGAIILWAVLTGGGTATPSQSVTGADGLASTTFRLGSTVGSQSIRATLAGADPVTFTATATSAPASQLAIAGGDNQTATVKTLLPQKLVVRATDAFGNPKTGVAVAFTVTAGGGTLSSSGATTDALGLAGVDWTLGQTAGTQRVTATTSGIAPLTFTATGTAGAAANLVIVSGSGQSAAPGAKLRDSLVVRVTDAFDNAVKDAVVAWAPLGDAGRVSPASSKTDAAGRTAASWTLGSTGGPKEVRVTVSGLAPVEFQAAGTIIFASVMAGGRHACGLDEGGVAYCWGFNGDGQLGLGEGAAGSGPVFAVTAPSAVVGGQTFAALSGGGYHTCGTTLSANPYCWGKNVDGRLGDGSTTAATAPKHVDGTNIFQQLMAGGSHTCGLTPGGRLYCWGSNLEGQVGVVASGTIVPDSMSFDKPQALLPALNFSAVAAGNLHSCALTAAGTPWCWGNNQYGQLGTGGTTGASIPVPVTGGGTYVAIAAGDRHSCALTAAGAAWCWGDNSAGQVGTGTAGAPEVAPIAVTGGLSFVSLTAGANHTCGLTSAGIAYCWGGNASGQLGVGTTTSSATPVAVGGGLAFGVLSAGNGLTCGVTAGRVAYCWGNNQYGQVGDASTTHRSLPTKVAFQP